MCVTQVPVADSLTHTQIHQDRAGLCPPPNLLPIIKIKKLLELSQILRSVLEATLLYPRVVYLLI